MLDRLVLVSGLVAMAIYHQCHSCSVPVKWKKQEVSERAAMADIVIIGKVDRSPYRNARERQARKRQRHVYEARFQVLCTLKGGPLPRFINVSGFGREPGHCVNSHAKIKKVYIGLLRQRQGRYYAAEINSQRATVRFKKHRVRKILKRLGLKKSLHGCAEILPKEHPKNKIKSKRVLSRHEPDEVKNEVTAERTVKVLRLIGSNNAWKTTLAWPFHASVLLMIYSLVYILT